MRWDRRIREISPLVLRKLPRCDCNAWATYRVMISGRPLYFCDQHQDNRGSELGYAQRLRHFLRPETFMGVQCHWCKHRFTYGAVYTYYCSQDCWNAACRKAAIEQGFLCD